MAEKNTYRWTDEKGRTHFSDVPAPKSERLDIKRNGRVKAVTPDVIAAENKARECKRRQDQRAGYRNAMEITETDALGNQRNYTEAERVQLIERTEQQVKELCGDAATPQS